MALKPHLSFWQIWNMNFGFFGIQYSFGLQQGNMSPIYSYLGADPGNLAILWLAGPITGLLVQPIIGAMSDKTWTRWGRRTPYFFIGALIASLGLLFMPFSSSVWMAASLLWILDASNNVAQEPFRAFVSDRLDKSQHSAGFLMQSSFTGLGQTLAYLTPGILLSLGLFKGRMANNIPNIVMAAFVIGAIASIGSVLISIRSTPELPPSEEELAHLQTTKKGVFSAFADIGEAFGKMPKAMWQLAIMMFFQWYAMFCYWQYNALSVAKTIFHTTDPSSDAFVDATVWANNCNGFYNAITFLSSFLLVRLARRYGAKWVHMACLVFVGVSLLVYPAIQNKYMLFLPMVGLGVAWASMMSLPYVMVAGSIPPAKTGVYMGIFNMFIVIPMMIETFTLKGLYETILDGKPENVIRLAGGLLLAAAIAVIFVQYKKPKEGSMPIVAVPAH
jgi:maltose/moltooligosaccharide transporter